MADDQPFNPLDKVSLGQAVMAAMLGRPIGSLPPATAFGGAGIYAIYSVGDDYPAYGPIAALNREGRFEQPIYVGKAIPAGGRKGGGAAQPARRARPGVAIGGPLYKRLLEHTESIEQAKNLDLANFFCRYLTVDDIWIPLAESLLIGRFQPVWNIVIDGFGNHDPGNGRYNQQQSSWDVLHPGRHWAARLRENRKTEREILENLSAFLVGQPAEVVEDPTAGDELPEGDQERE